MDIIGGFGGYGISLGCSFGSVYDSYGSGGRIDGIFSETGSNCLVFGGVLNGGFLVDI